MTKPPSTSLPRPMTSGWWSRRALGSAEDVAEADHLAVEVGHLDADRGLAGDRGEQPHRLRRHRVGDVAGQVGDLLDLHTGAELDLVAGDGRAAHVAGDGRVDVELLEHRHQAFDHLVVAGGLQLRRRTELEDRLGRQLVAARGHPVQAQLGRLDDRRHPRRGRVGTGRLEYPRSAGRRGVGVGDGSRQRRRGRHRGRRGERGGRVGSAGRETHSVVGVVGKRLTTAGPAEPGCGLINVGIGVRGTVAQVQCGGVRGGRRRLVPTRVGRRMALVRRLATVSANPVPGVEHPVGHIADGGAGEQQQPESSEQHQHQHRRDHGQARVQRCADEPAQDTARRGPDGGRVHVEAGHPHDVQDADHTERDGQAAEDPPSPVSRIGKGAHQDDSDDEQQDGHDHRGAAHPDPDGLVGDVAHRPGPGEPGADRGDQGGGDETETETVATVGGVHIAGGGRSAAHGAGQGADPLGQRPPHRGDRPTEGRCRSRHRGRRAGRALRAGGGGARRATAAGPPGTARAAAGTRGARGSRAAPGRRGSRLRHGGRPGPSAAPAGLRRRGGGGTRARRSWGLSGHAGNPSLSSHSCPGCHTEPDPTGLSPGRPARRSGPGRRPGTARLPRRPRSARHAAVAPAATP